MLFLHEVHQVRGAQEEAFETLYRDAWRHELGADGRLLWYCHHTHGTGPAYHVVTITAVADGAAYERLATRVQTGDLRAWGRDLDAAQHGSIGKVLVALPWSPMGTLDLATVPVDDVDHEPVLFMEDTGWPHAPLDDYTGFWERVYLPLLHGTGRDRPRLLEIAAVFQPAHGGGRRKEAILFQRIVSNDGLLGLLTHETPPELKAPGTFMHDALQVRDQWESKLLRTARWSPLA